MGRIKKFVLSDKGRKALIIGALAVMLLLLLSTVSCGGDKTSSVNTAQPAENAAEIERTLEKRVTELISRIDGVGEVSVMVTLDTVSEVVYEKDHKSETAMEDNSNSVRKSSENQTEVVLQGSSKQPLQIGTIQPKVRGAAVVCEGAEDPIIREKVTNAVAKALNIGISRVYVTN